MPLVANIGNVLNKLKRVNRNSMTSEPSQSSSTQASRVSSSSAKPIGHNHTELRTTTTTVATGQDHPVSPTTTNIITDQEHTESRTSSTSDTEISSHQPQGLHHPLQKLSITRGWTDEMIYDLSLPGLSASERLSSDNNSQESRVAEPTTPSVPTVYVEQRSEYLWDVAYTTIDERHPDLVKQFESILQQCSRPFMGGHEDSPSSRGDKHELMSAYLEGFLKKPLRITDASLEVEMQPRGHEYLKGAKEFAIESVRANLRRKIEKSRFASIAWVASCLVLETLLRCNSSTESSQLHLVSVLARMEWYVELPRLLFRNERDATEDPSKNDSSNALMEKTLICLYESIILYLIKIVCYFSTGLPWPAQGASEPVELERIRNNIRNLEQILPTLWRPDLQNGLYQIFRVVENIEQDDHDLLDKLAISKPQHVDVGEHYLISDDFYEWLSHTQEYQRFTDWESGTENRVMWIDGGPGAGKTKLLRAVAQRLPTQPILTHDSMSKSNDARNVAYFFRDSGSVRNSNAVSVVKVLLYHILKAQPELEDYVESKFRAPGCRNFNKQDVFFSMAILLYALLEHPRLHQTYFIVDVIEELMPDEALTHETADDTSEPTRALSREKLEARGDPLEDHRLENLLFLIATTVQISSKIRWLVSVDTRRQGASSRFSKEAMPLCITVKPEIPEIRDIVHKYAESQITQLTDSRGYGKAFLEQLITKIQATPGSFVWVDMALNALRISPTFWNAPYMLEEIVTDTPDIQSFYENRYKAISRFRTHDQIYCRDILSAAAIAYRALRDSELREIVDIPLEVDLTMLVNDMLHPFLELYEDESGPKVQFIHLSAKDFVFQKIDIHEEHVKMVKRCLGVLWRTFGGYDAQFDKRDSVDGRLKTCGDYAAVSWIRHAIFLGAFDDETRENYMSVLWERPLEWLEVLDSRNLLLEALNLMNKLDLRVRRNQDSADNQIIRRKVREATDLIRTHCGLLRDVATETRTFHRNPNNSRAWAKNSLLFCPSASELRKRLMPKYLPWLAEAPIVKRSSKLLNNINVMTHPDWVRSCSFSTDGRLLLSGSDDRRVRLWDVETGRLQHILEGFDSYVYSVVVSHSGPNGRALMAACDQRTVRIWELYTGREITKPGHFEPEKATSSDSQGVEAIETEDKEAISEVKEDAKAETKEETKDEQPKQAPTEGKKANLGRNDAAWRPVTGLSTISMTRDGTMLAAATAKGVVMLDVLRLEETIWEDGGAEDVYMSRVVLAGNGLLLASSTASNIAIWDVQRQEVKLRLPRRAAEAADEARNHEETTGEPSNETSKIAPEPDAIQHTHADGHTDFVSGLAFSPDSTLLASCSNDMTARIWDVKTGRLLAVLRGHQDAINNISFSAEGTYIATASDDFTIGIWTRPETGNWDIDASTLPPSRILRGHDTYVLTVAFDPVAQTLASSDSNAKLRLWNLDLEMDDDVTGVVEPPSQPIKPMPAESIVSHHGHTKPVSCVAISPDGRIIVSGSDDGTICFWSGDTGGFRGTLEKRHGDQILCLVFSQDSSLLVSTSVDEKAFVWSVATETVQYPLDGHEDWIRSVAISPDGHLIATGSDDTTIRLWDLSAAGPNKTDKEKEDATTSSLKSRELRAHSDYVLTVAFSPDGSRLVSGGDDSRILIWNVTKDSRGDELPVVKTFQSPRSRRIRAVVFSPSGNEIISSHADGNMMFWGANKSDADTYLCEFDTKQVHLSLRFDKDHPNVLLTQFGVWPYDLEDILKPVQTAVEGPRQQLTTSSGLGPLDQLPSWAPVSIDDKQKWITWQNRRVIYLPDEFRPTETDEAFCVQGHRVVIGCDSGQVLLFRFSEKAQDTAMLPFSNELS
ncbi:WD40-repeat-containing domain protein [Xylariaceae sp. FL1272]|nr:WD40-repeat-containing domain protein [Xylariaceae sp. FL1272]